MEFYSSKEFFILLGTVVFQLLFIIYLIVKLKRGNNELEIKKMKILFSAKFDVESDFKFLNQVIQAELDKVKLIIFPLLSAQKKGNMIKDSEIKEQTEKSVQEIMNSLSPYYIKSLEKYLDGEVYLTQYLVNKVYNELMSSALNSNKKYF